MEISKRVPTQIAQSQSTQDTADVEEEAGMVKRPAQNQICAECANQKDGHCKSGSNKNLLKRIYIEVRMSAHSLISGGRSADQLGPHRLLARGSVWIL